jgi:hypothetical protein
VYWPRPVAYYPRPAYVPGFWWGSGIGIGAGFFFGAFNWPGRHATNVVTVNNYYYTRNIHANRPGGYAGRPVPPVSGAAPAIAHWQHDPGHRRGVPYRDPAVREAAVRDAGARGLDPRTVRGDARAYNQTGGGNRVDIHPAPQDRREADARPHAPASGSRPDWREGHGDNTRPEARFADPRGSYPAPNAGAAPLLRDGRPDGRGMSGSDSRPEHRGEWGDGRREPRMAGNPGAGASSPAAVPAPVTRAPEARAQPRTEGRGDGRADYPGGYGRSESRAAEVRGDTGRGRDPRGDTRGYGGPPATVQQPIHAPAPPVAEARMHAAPPQQPPMRAPEVRAQAPSAPAMAAQPVARPSAPPQAGGGSLRGGGNGGGGMFNGGGPQMR